MSSRKKAFLFGSIIFLLSLALASYFVISHPETLRNMVLQQIDDIFGQKIRIDGVDVSMFPHPQIELRNVALGEQEGTMPFFRASRVTLDIRIFPLLKEQIVPKHLLIVNPEFIFHRNVSRHWVPSNREGEESGLLSSMTIALGMPAITLTQGRVMFVDEFHPNGPQTLVMEDISLGIKQGNYPVDLDFTFTGRLPHSTESGVVSLYSSLEFLPGISSSGRQLPGHEFDNIKVSGRINMKDIHVQEVEEFFQLTAYSSFKLRGISNFQGDFTLTPGL